MPPLARLPQVALHTQQLLYVARVVQPQLHPEIRVMMMMMMIMMIVMTPPDEGFPPLDAEHVPRLGLAEQLGHGALAQPEHELSEQLQQREYDLLDMFIVRNGSIELSQIV